jgi:hypothetical protein
MCHSISRGRAGLAPETPPPVLKHVGRWPTPASFSADAIECVQRLGMGPRRGAGEKLRELLAAAPSTSASLSVIL